MQPINSSFGNWIVCWLFQKIRKLLVRLSWFLKVFYVSLIVKFGWGEKYELHTKSIENFRWWSCGPCLCAGFSAIGKNPYTLYMRVDEIEVTWPSGEVQTFKKVKPNHTGYIVEGRGLHENTLVVARKWIFSKKEGGWWISLCF